MKKPAIRTQSLNAVAHLWSGRMQLEEREVWCGKRTDCIKGEQGNDCGGAGKSGKKLINACICS